MYYILKDRFLLRGWEKLPYALVDRKNGRSIFIYREEFDVISLCNGTVNMDLPIISPQTREMIATMEKKRFCRGKRNAKQAPTYTGISPLS